MTAAQQQCAHLDVIVKVFGAPGATTKTLFGDGTCWSRGIVGGGLYLALAGLFGLALGTVIRSTTATVTTLFGVMLIVQAFAPALPGGLGDWVSKYWPPIAGGQIITSYQDPTLLSPWAGVGVMAGCVAALMTAAFVVFRKRDA